MGNVAYDFDRFGARRLDEEEVERRRKIVEVRREEKLKKEHARNGAKTSAKAVLISGVLFIMVGLSLYCRVQLNEINDRYTAIKKEITIEQSNRVRLNMELDSMASVYSIDEYAEEVLNMHKIQENQINYLDLSNVEGAKIQKDTGDL